MLRTVLFALASLALFSNGPVSAQPATLPASDAVSEKPSTSASGTQLAKAEEDDAPSAAADQPAAENVSKDSKDGDGDKKPAAEAKPAPEREPTLTASVDLSSQTITVMENGVSKYTWAISSGTQSHPTPRGSFRPEWTAKMWYSRKYDNAPMPNAVFVHNGVAIHATYATGMLGRPASHGCIRLSPTNAKTFYNLVQRHGVKNTRVSIYGTPKWGSDPYVASRKTKQPQAYAAAEQDTGWDWFGLSSKPAYRPARAPQAYYAKKRKSGGAMYYYAANGNVYVVKPRAGSRAYGKRTYYNGYGYGYSSAW